jgi:hypothetical protein
MDRNPDAFKGGNFTADQVGQRIVQRNPSLKSLLADTETSDNGGANTGVAPMTEDQASAQSTGAFFPANTQNPSMLTEPLKVIPNMIPSAWNFAKGALDMINPVSIAKKIGTAFSEAQGLGSDIAGAKASQQQLADTNNKLIESYNKAKAAGKDVSQIETLFKNEGIDPTKYQTPAPTPGAFGSVMKEVPGAAYQTLVPEAGRSLVSAVQGGITGNNAEIYQNLNTFQRDIVNDPVGSILPFIMAAEGGAKALDKVGITTDAAGALDRGITRTGQAGLKVADIVTKPAQYVFGKVGEVVGKAVEATKSAAGFAGRQLTGINAETARTFAENPELKPVTAEGLVTKREELGSQIQNALASKKTELGVSPETLGQEVQSSLAKRAADLEESGKGYEPIRKAETPVKVEPDFLESTIKDTTGVDIKDGKVETNAAAKVRDAKDVRALQHFYDTYQPLFEKGQMTANEFLNMRSDLAKLSKFEREIGKSSDLEASTKLMRGKVNSAYRPQLTGLSDLDKTFSSQTADLKVLTKGLVDRNGALTDTGLSKVAKATADKPQLLAQLEQVSPGITERINALHQFNELGSGLVDGEGNITDVGMKKISNAANEANPQMLARLEEIKPGITKAIKQYKALQDVVNASEKFKVGTYGRNIGGAGVLAGIMTMNPALIATAVAEMILTNPENAIKIIQTYAVTKPIMQAIVSALKNRVMGTLKAINESTVRPTGSKTEAPQIEAPKEEAPQGTFAPKQENTIASKPIDLYHGTDQASFDNIQKKGFDIKEKIQREWSDKDLGSKGVSFSKNIDRAKEFTGDKAAIVHAQLQGDANVVDWKKFNDLAKEIGQEKALKQLKVDALWDGSEGSEEMLVINLDKLKVKTPEVPPIAKQYYHGSANPAEVEKNGFNLYKAGSNSGYKGVYGKGVYLTNELDRAKLYGEPMKIDLGKSKLWTLDAGDVQKELFSRETQHGDPEMIAKLIKDKGYDGVRIIGKDGAEEISMVNPESLKVKGKKSNFGK